MPFLQSRHGPLSSVQAFEGPLKQLGRSLEDLVGRTRQRLDAALAIRQLRVLFRGLPTNRLSTAVYSWVLPVSTETLPLVRESIRSLRGQITGCWQLVLVPHGPSSAALDSFLAEVSVAGQMTILPGDPHRLVPQAYADGTRAASGSWVGYLRPESRLAPEALVWLELATGDNPEARWFYSDEEFREGRRRQVNFKPDFSVEHLWSQPFTGQLSIYHKPLLDQLGLPTAEFGAAWQHDLGLRLADACRPEQIRHVPVALHETVLPADGLNSWLRLTPEHHAATRAAFARRNVQAELAPEGSLNLPRIRLRPHRQPRVAVVIATRDHAELVIPCIRSLRENTCYRDYELIVIDNQSQEPQLLDYLATEAAQGHLRVHRYDQPFNHSEMHNEVLFALDAEHVVLLNNDVDGFSTGWLEELVGTVALDERIAAVGAQLCYPNETIQHAGMFLLCRHGAVHSHRDWPRTADGYFGRLRALQEYSSVTGAVLLVRQRAFCQIGGFDSARFPTSFNDVDLCLRLRQAGYRCLYNPSVQAYHLESKTRGHSPREREFRRTFKSLWAAQLDEDPFYNRNLPRKKLLAQDWSVCPPRELLRTVRNRLARSVPSAA